MTLTHDMVWTALMAMVSAGVGWVIWWLKKHERMLERIPDIYATKVELKDAIRGIDGSVRDLRSDFRESKNHGGTK